MNGYKSATKIQKDFDISASALRSWAEAGKIQFIRYSNVGKRYYKVEDVQNMLCSSSRDITICDNKKTIILWYNKKSCIRTYIKIYTYYIKSYDGYFVVQVNCGLKFENMMWPIIEKMVESFEIL